MASVMAIISKKQFQQLVAAAELGSVVPLTRYDSSHRSLTPLTEGGALFCVTVRPDDQLWLVALLERPRFVGDHWEAAPNRVALTNITPLLPELRFSTGKGVTAAPGKLAMSLQTPRSLTEDDEALLRAAAAATMAPAPQASRAAPRAAEPKAAPEPATPKATKSTPLASAPLPRDVGKAAVALQQLRAGDKAAALATLLDAWAERRSAELAEAIEALGADIDRSLEPPPGKGAALADSWLELAAARRTVDVGRLLASLVERAGTPQMRRLLPEFLAFPADPRLSQPLLALLGKYTSSGATPALTQALEVLAHVADPRLQASLADFQQGERSWLAGVYKKARKLAAALPTTVPTTPEAERATLRELAARMAELAAEAPSDAAQLLASGESGAGTGDALLAAVFAAPHDDAQRLVYADWLLERGDPRGELIQLQYKKLDRGLDRQESKRERELLKTRSSDWIGPLSLVASDLSFARGFLDACTVSFRSAKQRAVIGDAHWSTVRELRFASDRWRESGEEPDLLMDPGLRALETVHDCTAETVLRWLETDPDTRLCELRAMQISDTRRNLDSSAWDGDETRYQRNAIPLWKALCALPRARQLRRLDLSPCTAGDWDLLTGFDWLYASPLGQSLRHFRRGVGENAPPLASIAGLFERMPQLEVAELHAAGGWGYNQTNAELLARAERRNEGYTLHLTLTRPFIGDEEDHGLRNWVEAVLPAALRGFPQRHVPELELTLHRRPNKSEKQRLRRFVAPAARGKFQRIILPDGEA